MMFDFLLFTLYLRIGEDSNKVVKGFIITITAKTQN